MQIQDLKHLAEEILGYPGKMISGSKSFYREKNPQHFVVFNSNICTKSAKIWYGDIDLTMSKESVIDLARKIGEKIYVLYEMDGRFENENAPLVDKAVVVISPDEKIDIRQDLQKYFPHF